MAACLRVTMCALGIAWAAAAWAQSPPFPVKPVRVVLGGSAGGPYDDAARAIGPRLTEVWGQSVVVESRAGAGGIIAAGIVAKSPPDGYTLYLANAGAMTINPSLHKSLPYSPQRDFIPISLVATSPMVLLVHPSLPVRDVKGLVALAKAKPGVLNYASAGVGNLQHLTMELLQSTAGTRMNHVPYKGVMPAMTDLLGGQVDLQFANVATPGLKEHDRNGRVRFIGLSAAKRSQLLPQVPSIAETYPEFDVTTWMGLFAPAATPREIVAKIAADLNNVLARADIRERFLLHGQEIVAGSAAQMQAVVQRETALYAKIVKGIGLTPE